MFEELDQRTDPFNQAANNIIKYTKLVGVSAAIAAGTFVIKTAYDYNRAANFNDYVRNSMKGKE
jgi:hypothetical protein